LFFITVRDNWQAAFPRHCRCRNAALRSSATGQAHALLPRALDERNEILRRPWPEIAPLITDTGEYAARLREPTPFADILAPDERERAYAAFRT
jgi:hypothetical protein